MELDHNKTANETERPKNGSRKVAVLRIVAAPPKEVCEKESMSEQDKES
jgi:hypothetical protein